MHGRQFRPRRISHEQVQGLRLIHKNGPVGCEVYDGTLRHFPCRLEHLFDVIRYGLYFLDRPIGGNDVQPHFFTPQIELFQLCHQEGVENGKLSREDSPKIDEARHRLETFRVAHNLCRRCSWHRGHEKRVAEAVLGYVLLE